MPPKEAMSQSNLHWRQCGADWYPDWPEFESPPQPPQLPDWACEPKWVFEFQDFIKGPLGYYAWKLATETDPTPQTPVANVLLGLRQMVQGLRDAWGLAGTRRLKLPREVLEWTAECELRSPRLAAATTSTSTQISPPPRPTVTRGATTKAETSPAPLTAPATSVLTTGDRGVLGAGKIDIDPRKKWGGGAEVGHVPDSVPDSEVEKATQARPAPAGKLQSQSAQPKPVCDCDVLSLGKFANKAQQTAAISSALPRPPPLPVQAAPGSQVPQSPEESILPLILAVDPS